MRPLSLEIEGFMSYRERTCIDFSTAQVFVLSGPTGSGKSSIIDAMVYALYGRTPRISEKGGLSELVWKDQSQPVKEARVDFCFEHQGRQYRVIRRQPLRGSRQGEVHWRLPGDTAWQAIALQRNTDLDTYLTSLIGLDYEAFTRIILLPQGSFDTFLRQDKAKNRRDFLKKVTGLDIYDQILSKAKEHVQALNQKITALTASIQSRGVMSLEQLQALEQALEDNEQQIASLQRQGEECQQQLLEYRQVLQWCSELETCLIQQKQHQQQADAMAALARKHAQEQQLAALGGELKRYLYLKAQLQEIEQKKQQLHQQQQALAAKQTDLAQQLEAFEAERAALPAHEKRYQALLKLEYAVTDWQDKKQEWARAQKQAIDLQQNLQQTQDALQAVQNSLHALEVQIHAQQQVLAQSGWDQERLAILSEYLPQLQQLDTHYRPLLAKQSAQLASLQEELRQTEQQHLQALQAIERFSQEQQALEKQAQVQKERIQTLETEHRAHILRQGLHVGDPCPVCHQVVQTLPEGPAPEALAAALSEEKRIQTALKNNQQALARQQASAQATLKDIQKLQQQQQQLQQEYAHTQRALENLQEQLHQVLGAHPNDAALRAEAQALRQAQKRHQQLERELQDLQRQMQAQALKQQKFEERRQQVAAQLESAKQQMDTLWERLQALEQRLQEALGTPRDYFRAWQRACAELEQVLQRFAAYQEQLQRSQEALNQEEKHLDTEWIRQREKKQAIVQELEVLCAALQVPLQALGFTAIEEAAAVSLSEQVLAAQEKRLKQYEMEGQMLQQRIQALTEQLAGRTATPQDIQVLEQQMQEIKAALSRHEQIKGEIRAQLREGEKRYQQNRQDQQELEQVQRQQQLYETIVSDLGTRNLDEFIYKRIMDKLLQEGSAELLRMSDGRYCFALAPLAAGKEEELVILDAWNAQEPRSLKTLSGGETFLASLALALALNSYLSGQVHLGSMFIDEGFGTLDPETLNFAAEAIEALQASGKFIGLITHIPELAERFEHRLEIQKSVNGSRVKWI